MALSYDNAVNLSATALEIGRVIGCVERAMMAVAARLETELKVFELHRSEWARSQPGRYVVIQGERALENFFDDYGAAFNAGLKEFGIGQSFLVKQIWIEEPLYFVA